MGDLHLCLQDGQGSPDSDHSHPGWQSRSEHMHRWSSCAWTCSASVLDCPCQWSSSCVSESQVSHVLSAQVVVEQLRQLCLEEGKGEAGSRGYSALTQDPGEWTLEPGKPCSGERLLLMFDRWRKLAKVQPPAWRGCTPAASSPGPA